MYRSDKTHPLDQAIEELLFSGLGDHIRVFGEAKKSSLPKSIEIFIDANQLGLAPEDVKLSMKNLLAITRANYGSIKPYVSIRRRIGTHPSGRPVFEQILWTTTANATGWTKANKKGPTTAAGRGGIPLRDYVRKA